MSDPQVPYTALSGLEHFYFEDSYVLGACVSSGSVEFALDLVLTPEHPQYKAPLPDEQYCMRRATLRFDQASTVKLSFVVPSPTIDADGEIDYGNIDSFYREGSAYHLDGPWGEIEIASAPPIVLIR